MVTSSSSSETSERPDVPTGLARFSPDGLFVMISQSAKLAIAKLDEAASASCQTKPKLLAITLWVRCFSDRVREAARYVRSVHLASVRPVQTAHERSSQCMRKLARLRNPNPASPSKAAVYSIKGHFEASPSCNRLTLGLAGLGCLKASDSTL